MRRPLLHLLTAVIGTKLPCAMSARMLANGRRSGRVVVTLSSSPVAICDMAVTKFLRRKMIVGPHSVSASFLLCSRNYTAQLACSESWG